MFYPLKFKPVYKDYIWGGRNLEKLGKELPPTGNVAESWEISCHSHGISEISNGEFAGTLLTDLIKEFGRQVIGMALPEKDLAKFPLLIKLIDANEKLSVQVHPNDDYAYNYEHGELGKHEMWYIISAQPGAKLVCGIHPGVSKEIFTQAIKENNIESCLKFIEVFPGDAFNIPAGTIHAIGPGIILAEIQQNADTTYRVYDYDRIDQNGDLRPLHLKKALEVIDFNSSGRREKNEGLIVKAGENLAIKYLVANQYFAVELYDINGSVEQDADGNKFYFYVVTEGDGEIRFTNGTVSVKKGESVFIPALLGNYTLQGKFSTLKGYVPDLTRDIIVPLRKVGYSEAEIVAKVSGLK